MTATTAIRPTPQLPARCSHAAQANLATATWFELGAVAGSVHPLANCTCTGDTGYMRHGYADLTCARVWVQVSCGQQEALEDVPAHTQVRSRFQLFVAQPCQPLAAHEAQGQ